MKATTWVGTVSLLLLACSGDGPPGAAPAPASGADETLCGDVQLAAPRVVPAGRTLTICAGSTVTAMGPSVALTVQGKLVVQGAAGKPVKLAGAQGGSTDWQGVSVAAGGELSATYLEIRNATVALATMAAASFTIDHLVIETCDAMLALGSDGSLAHGTLHGLGQNQESSPIAVSQASPRITDTVVDQGAFNGVDMIVVDGETAAPVFDHLEVADSHCAFHFDTATGATISNSYIHHNAYGLMVISSAAGHVVHNNFQDNQVNIGDCYGGSAEVKDNYFDSPPFDRSCIRLTVSGASPSAPYPAGVGPSR